MKKGFTIVEILVAIIILGIIAAIAVPTYLNINNAAKEEVRNNKIKQIELAAEKWADELNLSRPITIPVLQLIQNGYLSADEGSTDSVIDPVSSDEMKCHEINITFDNYIPNAAYEDDEMMDCEVKLAEENDPNIIITAITSDNEKLEFEPNTKEFAWTNKDVMLIVDVTEEYTLNDGDEIIFSGSGINETKTINASKECSSYTANAENCSNAINVTGQNIIAEIYVSINTEQGIKSKDITVKIDKQAPTITAKINTEDEWVNHDRTITITSDDGNVGSGVDIVGISTTNTTDGDTISNEGGSTTVEKDNGNYYIYAYDKAGNKSYARINDNEIITISGVDKTKPSTGYNISTNWINTDREVTIYTVDDTSGIAGYFISTKSNETLEGNKLANTELSENQLSHTFTDKLSTNGTYYIYAVDKAGNVSDPTVTNSNGIKQGVVIEENIDKTKPKISSVTASNVESTSFNINVAASDASGSIYSGIAQYKIYIDGSLKQTINTSSTSISVSRTGLNVLQEYKIVVEVIDKAGNSTTYQEVKVKTILENYTYNPDFNIAISWGINYQSTSRTINSSYAPNFTHFRYAKIYWQRTSYQNHGTGLNGDSNLRVNGTEIDSNPYDGYQNTLTSGTYQIYIKGSSSFSISAQITSTKTYTSVTYKIYKIEFIV